MHINLTVQGKYFMSFPKLKLPLPVYIPFLIRKWHILSSIKVIELVFFTILSTSDGDSKGYQTINLEADVLPLSYPGLLRPNLSNGTIWQNDSSNFEIRKCKISQGPGIHMSGNLQPLSSSPPGQTISLGLHFVGQLAGHRTPEGDLTER